MGQFTKDDKFKRRKPSAALYRDGALSEVGLPDQNVEERSSALSGLLLNLSDDVTQLLLVLSSY